MRAIISIGGRHPDEKPSRGHKGSSLLTLIDDYVALDLETTGLDPSYDDIIEVAALRVRNNEIVDSFQSLIKPLNEIDDFITQLTGITNEMLETSPSPQEVLPAFFAFLADDPIIAHNANFDVNFLYDQSLEYLDNPFPNSFVDTMRLSRRLFQQERRHRLIDVVSRFKLADSTEHRALSDAQLAHRCYQYMKAYMAEENIDIKDILPRKYPGSNAKRYTSAKDIQTTTEEIDETTPVFGQCFAFTGALERMPRKDAMQIVVNMGGICGDGVTKKTNFLVLGNNDYCTSIKDGKSTKQKKAEKLQLTGQDIEIISENVFYEMIITEEA